MEAAEIKTDHERLRDYMDTKDTIARLRKILTEQEQEIIAIISNRGDTAIADQDFTCELKSSWQYDHEKFTPLKEVLIEADLASVYEAAYEKTTEVPERWDTTKILALGRRHNDVQAVIDQARFPGEVRLEVKPR